MTEPQKIATKGFMMVYHIMTYEEQHIKSLGKLVLWKVIKNHFKSAYWLPFPTLKWYIEWPLNPCDNPGVRYL